MKHSRSLALSVVLLFAVAFPAQAQWQVPSGSIPVGKGPGNTGFNTVTGSGGAGTKCLLDTTPPTFGACNGAVTGAALTRTNDTNVTVTLGGTPSTALLQGVSLTLGWTGTLDYPRGGCNAATQVACRNNIFPTPTRAGDVAYWNGTIWTTLAGNNTGTRVLTEDASGVPSWTATGGVNSLNSLTGALTFTVSKQTFTASGTYTPSAGTLYAMIECVGAGGAGGGTAGAATNLIIGAGGGGGGYARTLSTAASIGASQTVTIGTGGTAGAAGNNAGNAGSDTSVGTLCIGKGGGGGAGGTGAGTTGAGGAGGVAGTGDFTFPGGHGAGGLFIPAGATSFGGTGGISYFSGGSLQGTTCATNSVSGSAGKNYGGGGQGGCSSNTGTNSAGGAGANGAVFITEYRIN